MTTFLIASNVLTILSLVSVIWIFVPPFRKCREDLKEANENIRQLLSVVKATNLKSLPDGRYSTVGTLTTKEFTAFLVVSLPDEVPYLVKSRISPPAVFDIRGGKMPGYMTNE